MAAKNRTTSKSIGDDDGCKGASFTPSDVACRVFGANTTGTADAQENRLQIGKAQRQMIVQLGLLKLIASSELTLRGGEPSENEIRDLLQESGWQRVPISLQNLPAMLMGTAWWHESEELILVDARKPNFKKTPFGILPIDLVLSELPKELLHKL